MPGRDTVAAAHCAAGVVHNLVLQTTQGITGTAHLSLTLHAQHGVGQRERQRDANKILIILPPIKCQKTVYVYVKVSLGEEEATAAGEGEATSDK